MKRLKRFNESSMFHKKEDIIRFVSEIRECCLEFEDDESIDYNFSVAGNDLIFRFTPGNDFDEWFERGYSFVKGNTEFCLSLNFKIKERKVYKGDSYLTGEGINKLEDIITIKRRLEDYFDIIMQMDYNHHLYKPISLKIFYREF
jgi:hypothetical protein